MRLSQLFPAAVLGALVLAGGASAGASTGTLGLALYDIHTDLAQASHNRFGDVKVWKRKAALADQAHGAALVRCGDACTFGAGWLAFSGEPAFSAGEVVAAKVHGSKHGWGVVLTLTPRGWSSWQRFSRQAALSGATRGVPDALVLVLEGNIVAQPLASQVVHGKTTVKIPGLSRADALRVAKLLG